MKKMLAALCAAVMTACAMAAPAFAEEQSRDVMIPESERAYFNAVPVYALGDDLSLYEKGDVNLDGEVDVKDGNLILLEVNVYSVISMGHLLDESQRSLANLNQVSHSARGDQIDSVDANALLCYCNSRLIGLQLTMDEFLTEWNKTEGSLS